MKLSEKHNYSVSKLLDLVGLSSSSYYYSNTAHKAKRTPSKYTYHKEKGYVTEQAVIASIKCILSHEFIDCGYHLMSSYLRKEGYIINDKKVYRIMKSQGLLKKNARIPRGHKGKKYVKFRKVKTDHPMHCIEMDIKSIWIPSKGKNAYLLSIIDVHTRKILVSDFDWTMKQDKVIELLSSMIEQHGVSSQMVIRSDNGSQFIAYKVREYISLVGIEQEFTHVATPEENAHIEAYHGTLKREVLDRVDYRTFEEIKAILQRFERFYNQERLHGLLGRITPNQKWENEIQKTPFKNKKIA